MRASKAEPLEEELKQLETRIKKIAEKKDKYFNLFEEDIIDNTILAEKLNDITDELEKLDARKSQIESELSDSSTAPVTYELVEQSLKSFNMLLKQASSEQQKSILRLGMMTKTLTL